MDRKAKAIQRSKDNTFLRTLKHKPSMRQFKRNIQAKEQGYRAGYADGTYGQPNKSLRERDTYYWRGYRMGFSLAIPPMEMEA